MARIIILPTCVSKGLPPKSPVHTIRLKEKYDVMHNQTFNW